MGYMDGLQVARSVTSSGDRRLLNGTVLLIPLFLIRSWVRILRRRGRAINIVNSVQPVQRRQHRACPHGIDILLFLNQPFIRSMTVGHLRTLGTVAGSFGRNGSTLWEKSMQHVEVSDQSVVVS